MMGHMATYDFREAAELTGAQVAETAVMGTTDPQEPFFPAGIETLSLFGYVDAATEEVVAWAWGSMNTTMGELHVYVLPAHRRADLASRLAIRYLLLRNETLAEFSFVVTNPGLVGALRGPRVRRASDGEG
jgi:hypothetical protein